MSHRFYKPIIKESLFTAEERETKLDKLGDVLWILEEHVDFSALAASIGQAAPRPAVCGVAARSFQQKGWCVSCCCSSPITCDQQLEFQLLGRLSFQRFVGLRHSSQLPDRTTFWTFRERLMAAGASETI